MEKRKAQVFDTSETAIVLKDMENRGPFRSHQSERLSNSEKNRQKIHQVVSKSKQQRQQIIHLKSAHTVSMSLRRPKKQARTHFNRLENVKNTTLFVSHQSGQSSNSEQQKWHITKPKQSTPSLVHAFSMPLKPNRQDLKHFS